MAANAPSTFGDDDPIQRVRDQLKQGRAYRKRFEPTWASNLAFASGKHDLIWDRNERQLVMPPELTNRLDLYQADVITEQRAAALGEMSADDDRPQLLIAQEGEQAEEIAEQLNQAVGYCWDHEAKVEDALRRVRLVIIDLGVGAIRTSYDNTRGPLMQKDVPYGDNGKPITDLEQARSYVAQRQSEGKSANLRSINQGMTRLQIGSPYNLIVPAGIPHEDDFPWEGWVMPTPLDEIRDIYGSRADTLKEDSDITNVLGLGVRDEGGQGRGSSDGDGSNRLRDHAWLWHYYQRPNRKFPQGRVITLGGNAMVLLEQENKLPYCASDGSHRSGIHYFHWWRLNDRFFSRAFIENLKDPQRMINRRKRQSHEIIDRGMPKVFMVEGSIDHKPRGLPLEIITVNEGKAPPQFHAGVAPGAWMQADIQALREDLQHASTLSDVRLGENPQNVTTYAALALINENEKAKRASIMIEHRAEIARLTECIVYDIRTYWPEKKQIMIAGDDRAQAAIFEKSKIPDFYMVKTAKGSTQPRGQGAELQKVQDIANYSVTAGAPLPVDWFAESLKAGEAIDLPVMPQNDQTEVAELENHVLLNGGNAPVQYYDNPGVHIPIHRSGQSQARIADDAAALQRIEDHIQQHLEVAQENIAASGPQAPIGALPQGVPSPSPLPEVPPMGAAPDPNMLPAEPLPPGAPTVPS